MMAYYGSRSCHWADVLVCVQEPPEALPSADIFTSEESPPSRQIAPPDAVRYFKPAVGEGLASQVRPFVRKWVPGLDPKPSHLDVGPRLLEC